MQTALYLITDLLTFINKVIKRTLCSLRSDYKYWCDDLTRDRKKGVLRNFAKFTGKHQCQNCLRPATLLKKRDSGTGVFLWILRNSKNTSFYSTSPVAASGKSCSVAYYRIAKCVLYRNAECSYYVIFVIFWIISFTGWYRI